MSTLSLGAPTPFYEYRTGVLYLVGSRLRVPVPVLDGAVDLPTWLTGLGRVVCRQLGVDQAEIEVIEGVAVVTVRSAARPVGRRPRGARGGRTKNQEPRTERRGEGVTA